MKKHIVKLTQEEREHLEHLHARTYLAQSG